MRSISFGRALGPRVGVTLQPPVLNADSRYLTLVIFHLNVVTAGLQERHGIGREAGLQAMLMRRGIDLLSLSTEGDLVAELMRFAQMRRERKKLPSRQNLPRGAAMAAAG